MENYKQSFIVAILSLMGIFAAASSTVPLLGVFKDNLNIVNSDLAYTAVTYFLGCIVSLLFFSKISNSLGRKNATLLALLVCIVATVILIFTPSFLYLLLARFIHGLGCGLASSSIMSYIVDTAPPHKKQLASFFNICGPAIGFCLGCSFVVIANMSYQKGTTFIYIVLSCIEILLFILCLIFAKETLKRDYKSLLKNVTPKFNLPSQYKKEIFTTASLFVTTWLVGGFFQSFITVVTKDALNLPSSFSGIFFIIFIGTQTVGGLIVQKYDAKKSFVIATLLYCSLSFLLFGSAYFHSIIFFTLACFFMGFSATAAGTASLSMTLEHISIDKRASVIALIYLCGYMGAGLPNLIIGIFFKDLSLNYIYIIYPLSSLIMGAITLTIFKYGKSSRNLKA